MVRVLRCRDPVELLAYLFLVVLALGLSVTAWLSFSYGFEVGERSVMEAPGEMALFGEDDLGRVEGLVAAGRLGGERLELETAVQGGDRGAWTLAFYNAAAARGWYAYGIDRSGLSVLVPAGDVDEVRRAAGSPYAWLEGEDSGGGRASVLGLGSGPVHVDLSVGDLGLLEWTLSMLGGIAAFIVCMFALFLLVGLAAGYPRCGPGV